MWAQWGSQKRVALAHYDGCYGCSPWGAQNEEPKNHPKLVIVKKVRTFKHIEDGPDHKAVEVV